MGRPRAVLERAPERRRQERQPDVELVDELMADPAKPALRRAGPEPIALEEEHVLLTTLAEKERSRHADDPAADDDRRGGAREIAQGASSSNR